MRQTGKTHKEIDMNKLLATGISALALTLALGGASLAADAKAKTDDQSAPGYGYGYHGYHGYGPGAGHGRMAGLTPEKQEQAATIMQEHKEKVFPLRQELYAANAELEALLSKGDADPAKVKAADDKIAAVQAQIATEYASFRQRLYKEVGLRQAPHGMGMGMMGGMGGCGMMGDGGCPMMGGGMMGGRGGCGAGMGQQAPAKAPAKSKGAAN
jgi:Spy/CpxP family protein refolding chaperone